MVNDKNSRGINLLFIKCCLGKLLMEERCFILNHSRLKYINSAIKKKTTCFETEIIENKPREMSSQ